MHEFSIASQAVDKIVETALNRGAKKIRRVELLVGELNLLGEEQLIFWIKQVLNSKVDIAGDVKIEIKPVQAVIKCNRCGYEGSLKAEKEEIHSQDHSHLLFFCPSCDQADITIKKGREFVLNRVQIET